ncbi:MAG: ATP synthase F1 subunit delta [Planctomycetota bacterium]
MPNAAPSPVADAYAQALVELAEERSQLDEIADECFQLGNLLASDADFRQLMTSPMINADQRAGVIDRLFKDKITDTLRCFLLTLNRKKRIAHLGEVFIAFGRLINERRGVIDVEAVVAQEMPADQADGIKGRLSERLAGKTVNLAQRVDPALIGGLALRVGDTMIDGSVATRLNLMKRNMIDAGRERARVLAGAEGPSGQGAE